MKNDTNIYDIDGNIIRKAGDNHRFTIDEVEKLVDDLTEKVKQNPDNDVYKVYLDNAHKWLMYMYNNMSNEEIAKRLSFLKNSVEQAKDNEATGEKQQLDAIAEAMDKLKQEYEAEDNADKSDTAEVLESHETGTVMDEYVEFKEVEE